MKLIKQLTLFFLGLCIFSYGITTAIKVQHLGVHPWDVLNIALTDQFGLTIGTWSIICGIVLITVSFILDRSYIKLGTFLNALTIGPLVDLFLFLDWFPSTINIATDILLLFFGIILMGIGGGMYAAAGLGAGPRDGFMLSISDKLNVGISKVRIITETSVLIIGLLLGGPVFVFTFIITFIQSPIFQYSYQYWSNFIQQLTRTKEKKELTI